MPFPALNRVVGHGPVLARLKAAMNSGRLGHAHLFSGPVGVGKGTVATALAQALFCRQPETPGPSGCGFCPPCLKMAAGHHSDLMRLAVESNRTRIRVEQVRTLSGFLALTPLESAWKIAIIDGAEWMNEAAANALLKTLEEPPSQSLLILVAHHPGHLLATIRSRCRQTRFSSLCSGDLKQILSRLTTVDAATLELAAELAPGNVTQALKYCSDLFPEWRQRFFTDMQGLGKGRLDQLFAVAEHWGDVERFPAALVFLKIWLRRRIHDTVTARYPVQDLGESWLKLGIWSESLFRQAQVVNLNKRLVLEAVFVRLARLQGATF